MKKMIYTFIILSIVIYRSLACNATDSLITNDDKIRGSSRSEPTNIVIKDKSEILTFSYCRFSTPLSDSTSDELRKGGNNFFGISYSKNFQLKDEMGLKATMELLLGNINGHFSCNLSFIPTIIIGEFDMMNTYFGAGFSMQDLDKKNTGIGLTSIFGGSFYILRNLGIDFSFGYYDFGKYSFNSIKIGIDWIAD